MKFSRLIIAIAIIGTLILVPVAALMLRPHVITWLAIKGLVESSVDNKKAPLFNATIITVIDNEQFYKTFTGENGWYEVITPFPSNQSAPIYCFAIKSGFKNATRSAPLPPLGIVQSDGNNVVYGYVVFNFVMVSSS